MTDVLTTVQSHSLQDTLAIGAAVAAQAQPGDIIALIGELGAGKTQFVRGMAQQLDIDERLVSSPTFVLVQEYEPTDPDKPVLVHIDAYRLEGADDLETIGWTEAGEDLRHRAVVAVEWADLIHPALGDDWLEVRLEHAPSGRSISLSPHGNWVPRMKVLAESLRAFSGKRV